MEPKFEVVAWITALFIEAPRLSIVGVTIFSQQVHAMDLLIQYLLPHWLIYSSGKRR